MEPDALPAEPSPAPAPAEIAPVDLLLKDLTPVRRRAAKPAVMARLEANIRAVGLIEPLLVYQQDGQSFIVDGFLRYLVLRDLGVERVPCLILSNLDLYTPNRQVNYLSMSQRWRMLQRALPVVGEERLMNALGLHSLRSKFTTAQRKAICPEAITAVQSERLSRSSAAYLANVTHERQRAILALIEQAGDASRSFVRAQVIQTPVEQRVERRGKSNPWVRGEIAKQRLIDRLAEAEKQHDFYQGLYRTYVKDLLKLIVHARTLTTTPALCQYLATEAPDDLAFLRKMVQQDDSVAA